jgi:hypothetical protein
MTTAVLAVARQVADGQTREMECPHCGPNRIVLTKGGKLASCPAFQIYIKSGRQNGCGCLHLHHNATPKGCPFELADCLALRV